MTYLRLPMLAIALKKKSIIQCSKDKRCWKEWNAPIFLRNEYKVLNAGRKKYMKMYFLTSQCCRVKWDVRGNEKTNSDNWNTLLFALKKPSDLCNLNSITRKTCIFWMNYANKFNLHMFSLSRISMSGEWSFWRVHWLFKLLLQHWGLKIYYLFLIKVGHICQSWRIYRTSSSTDNEPLKCQNKWTFYLFLSPSFLL